MALFDFRKSPPPPLASSLAPAASPTDAAPRPTVTPMEDLLRLVIEEKASDLHISVGAPPVVRLRGHLVKLEMRALTPEDTETLARAITSEANMQRVNEEGSVDFGFTFRGDNRFRVSVYRQKGCVGIALRLVPRSLLTLDEIGFPEIGRAHV